MRIYDTKTDHRLLEATCNCCARKLKVEEGILKEGCFHADNKFGFFSSMDNELHSFDLCEECYKEIVKNFKIPVDICNVTEYL